MAFAAYLAVGPDPNDIPRANDVVNSIATYADHLSWIVLVDDSTEKRDLQRQVTVPQQCELVVLKNPRRGEGDGTRGGLCVADMIAYGWIQRQTAASFVIKLDTDSLVIGPFEKEINHAITTLDDPGILGVIGDSFGENRTYKAIEGNRSRFEFALKINSVFCQLTSEEHDFLRRAEITTAKQFESLLFARTALERACQNKYPLGQYCQGGGYVVSRRLLDDIAAAGLLSDPFVWLDVNLGEDVMMGIFCGAVGLRMYDLSGPNKPFAVQPGCLPFSPTGLLQLNSSVIHSIKGSMEWSFREFFLERRLQRNGKDGNRFNRRKGSASVGSSHVRTT